MTDTIAFVLYPGLTPLDVIGPLQALGALTNLRPEFSVVTVAANREPLESDLPVRLTASHTFAEVPQPYGLIVPGGTGPTFAALTDEALVSYVRESARTATVVGSVCTGSLILGAAGLLSGRRATTHWAAMGMLGAFGATPVTSRWVRDGNLITAAGVAAGIDMALYLVAELAGEEVARQVQLFIEYDPQPPFGPIEWETMDRAPVEAWLAQEVIAALEDRPELLSHLLSGEVRPS